MTRYLALDVGDERIGVARSDPTGLVATPIETIARVAGPASYERLCELIAEYDIDEILVGLPLLPSGDEGEQVVSTRAYVRGLERYIDIPIRYWDERDSTLRAEAIQTENRGRRRSRDQGSRSIDAMAAAVILQSFLDSHPGGSGE